LNKDVTGQVLDGKVLTALDNNFQSNLQARGKENFGYTFLENELSPLAKINSAGFDLILCGSDWCKEKILAAGLKNAATLVQGIEPQYFFPLEEEPPGDKFVIFSGGKLEYRKGQDLVIKAVQILQKKYPDIYLI